MANYVYENGELRHHGIRGMRWGVRRFQNKDGTRTAAGKKRYGDDTDNSNKKRKIKELSDTELREKVNRLELEKRYKNLTKEVKDSTTSPLVERGKRFIADVFENSAKNVATQTVTYAMGTGVNAVAKKWFDINYNVVNPKKGQKDK